MSELEPRPQAWGLMEGGLHPGFNPDQLLT